MAHNTQDAIQNIKILNYNANGIQRQRTLLMDFLHRHNVNIACITETHLIENEHFKIPGYMIYRCDRSSRVASGGVAILIKRRVTHCPLIPLNCVSIETIGIEIKSSDNSCLNIVCGYKQPNRRLCNEDLSKIYESRRPTLLVGDLNCKNTAWGCRCNNPEGVKLNNLASQHGLYVIAPNEFTYFPYRSDHQPDILDIVVLKHFNKTITQSVISELDSDHLPVILSFDNTPHIIPKGPRLINGIVDWKQFQTILDNETKAPSRLETTADIDTLVQQYTLNITTSVKKATIQQTRPIRNHWKTPEYILNLIRIKSRLRREFQRTRCPQLKTRVNNLTHKIKQELDNYRINSYKKFIEELTPNDPGMWRSTKKILNQPQTISPILVQNKTYSSDKDKAEIFSSYLEKVFSPVRATSSIHNLQVLNFVENHYPSPTNIRSVTFSEIKNILDSLPVKKSPGYDNIPNIVLKNLPKKFLTFLTSILNTCLTIGYFPKIWKHARILLFPKPGKNKQYLESYRPISLLTTLSKVLERVIYIRLEEEITERSALPPFQFGFRKHHSANYQLLRISETIEKGFENKQYTAVAFLDIAQAFDRVWLEGLKFKLLHLNLPSYITAILFSFLEDRTFSVIVNSEISQTRPIRAGVPQGSILGPMLFNIFVRDIPTDPSITAMFADDTALIAQDWDLLNASKQLQAAADILCNWFLHWNMKINASKCETKIFALRRIVNTPNIIINGEEIEWNPKDRAVKYLGVHLDTRLSWKLHVNNKLNMGYARLNQLYPIINRKSSLKTSCTLMLYRSLIRSLLLYACEVWGNTCKTNKKKLQVLQNRVLRIAVDAPWFMRNHQLHQELGMPTIEECIRKTTIRFVQKISNCESAKYYQLGARHIHKRLKREMPQDLYADGGESYDSESD